MKMWQALSARFEFLKRFAKFVSASMEHNGVSETTDSATQSGGVGRRLTQVSSAIALAGALSLAGCGGGGAQGNENAAQQGGGTVPTAEPQTTVAVSCDGSCATDAVTASNLTSIRLTVADVQQVVAQAVGEARARGVNATIAVSDRVGNILAVFDMNGADTFITATTSSERGPVVRGGLEAVNIIPAELAAIAKAVTGAYLSSEGNAFTTRTASQIVQEHFNPGEANTPSGPLFGVQFSQLPCSDFVMRFDPSNTAPGPGPHRSPLGLSADPGGIPLYKAGTPVGAIGVIADGIYDIDKDISGFDLDLDEIIATAGTVGFAAPVDRRGDSITVVGKTFRFSDSAVQDLSADPAAAPGFASIVGAGEGNGVLVTVPGYFDANGGVLQGVAFSTNQSGIRPANAGEVVAVDGTDLRADRDAFIFTMADGTNRFPPTADADLNPGMVGMDATEVATILSEAIGVANQGRAQIRNPLNSPIRVTVSVVDRDGNVLGMARTRDAPMFGADVSLQKARTAAFYSGGARAGFNAGTGMLDPTLDDGNAPADRLARLSVTDGVGPGDGDPLYLGEQDVPDAALVPADYAVAGITPGTVVGILAQDNGVPLPELIDYVRPDTDADPDAFTSVQEFLGIPGALESAANGGAPAAFADRSGGNLSRPTFPDGPDDSDPGPFSKKRGQWSVFSTGLQLDLVYNAVIQHVAFQALALFDANLQNNGTLQSGAQFGVDLDGDGTPDLFDVGDTNGDGFVDVNNPAAGESVNCTGNTGFNLTDLFRLSATSTIDGGATATANNGGLANGIQIFPGSVPIYRGDQLIGGIGVSGDGVDQDDMISFLGLHRAGVILADAMPGRTPVANAPLNIRADTLAPQGVLLRYVNCPQNPFVGTDDDNVCDGK